MSAEETEIIVVDTPKDIIDPDTTIFVGNITKECTEDDLKNVFESEFGSVEIEIPAPKTKNGRVFYNKYAFVKFPQKIDVDAIKEKYDKHVINDKGIYVRKALTQKEIEIERETRLSTRRANRDNFRGDARGGARGSVRGGRGGDRGGFQGLSVPEPLQARQDKTPLAEMEKSTDTLYVNNIPYYATKEDIAAFFGVDIESISLPMRKMRDVRTNRVFFSKRSNRGIAFATFHDLSEDLSKKVEEFQGKSFQDREIVVDIAAVRPPLDEEYNIDHSGTVEQTNE